MESSDRYINPIMLKRFNELIEDAEKQLWETQKNPGQILDPARLSQWATSSLNLLDKLSVSTNRFVQEFEQYGRVKQDGTFNIGLPLGVLKSARDEYTRGLAIDYQLSVSATVFGGLLSEAQYLMKKSYYRAATVLLGAALEEGLKARALAIPIELKANETLVPVIHKLKASGVSVLTEFQARKLEAIAKLRNDAAHSGEFDYQPSEIEDAFEEVEATLGRILSNS